MVDFTNLMRGSGPAVPSSLEDTFLSLDRKTTHVDLRPGQLELLRALDARLNAKDTVMRVSTGGGKTVIALLYLYHLMKKDRAPSLYLVPNTQLMEQVLQEAGNIGVPALPYPGGETYPPDSCIRAEAVAVCTYHKLFNGRSTFQRTDVGFNPSAIVLDDVHAGIEEVKNCYGARLSAQAFAALGNLLSSVMDKQAPGVWAGVKTGDEQALIEIPFWIWHDNLEEIRRVLQNYSDEGDLRFSWGHIADRLEIARCVFSGAGAYICLDPAPIQHWRPYSAAAHRLFMSASINDGSALIRELDCDPQAVAEQISSSKDRGPGERMIITASLIDPKLEIAELAKLARQLHVVANVVVLVSSETDSAVWTQNGAQFVSGPEVAPMVSRLRSTPRGNYVVFAQRYDGLDLPDDACRILILHGTPRGETLVDKFDQRMRGQSAGIRNRTVNRLEQGLGRAVRSPADYCAILLAGRDIGAFVGQASTIELLSPATKKQLEMSRELSPLVGVSASPTDAIRTTVLQCLQRDPSWRQYYASNMVAIGPPKQEQSIKGISLQAISERAAAEKAAARDYAAAATELNTVVNSQHIDNETKAISMERMARFIYHYDKAAAHDVLRKAYGISSCVSKPIGSMPAKNSHASQQAERVCSILSRYAVTNAAIADLETLRSGLNFANPARRVEESIRELGDWLGADSTMPEREYGRGPDNLWRFPTVAFVIEAKNEKTAFLSKHDAGQLVLSGNWCDEFFANDKKVLVLATNETKADNPVDFSFKAYALTEKALFTILDRLKSLAILAIKEGSLFSTVPKNIQTHISSQALLPADIQKLLMPVK